MEAQNTAAAEAGREPDAPGLMRRYKATGDLELRNRLVLHYLPCVRAAIASMRSILLSNIPYEDFFNQGVVTLMERIDTYDPARGASFETYIYKGVRGALLNYMRKQHWLPNQAWDARRQIAQSRAALEQSLQREPTDGEVARDLGLTEEKLAQYQMQITATEAFSLEELLEQNCEGMLGAGEGGVDQGLLRREMRQAPARAIDGLGPKHKQVIALYYYENLNLRQIGEVLDLSKQRVSQIRLAALRQLQQAMQEYANDGKAGE